MYHNDTSFYLLLILALSCCLRLLLALYAGLLVALSLAELGKNTGLNALSLKTTKRAVKSFIFFYSDFCHLYFPSLRCAKRYNLKFHSFIIMYFFHFVKIFCKFILLIFLRNSCSLYGVFQKHRYGHRTDAARNGSNKRCNLRYRVKIYVS